MSIEHGFVWMKIIPAVAVKVAEATGAAYGDVGLESADRPPKQASTESADRPPVGADTESADRPPKLTIVEESAAAADQHTAKFSRSFKTRGAARAWLASDPEGQAWKKGASRCCLVEVSES